MLCAVAAHHDMTACLCVSLFIGRGVLDEHACSCLEQCNASGPAQRRAVYLAQHRVNSTRTPAFSPAAKRRARITGTKSICVSSSLSGSSETRGGASSSAAATRGGASSSAAVLKRGSTGPGVPLDDVLERWQCKEDGSASDEYLINEEFIAIIMWRRACRRGRARQRASDPFMQSGFYCTRHSTGRKEGELGGRRC